MLISEELLLLLSKDDGTNEAFVYRDYGMTAAAIADLMAAGHVILSEDRTPRLRIVVPGPARHPALTAMLERLTPKDGRKIDSILMWDSIHPTRDVAEGLRDAGVIDIRERRLLGLVPTRFPTLDPQPERELRERLAAVIAGDVRANENDVVLLGILQGMDVARRVLRDEVGDLKGRALKARIEAIIEESPIGDALRRTIRAMATIIAAIAGGSAAAAAGG